MMNWWPGGSEQYASAPHYPGRTIIVVWQLVRGKKNCKMAMAKWNACGANVKLVFGSAPAFSPGTITVYTDNAGPYGDTAGDHGFLGIAGGRTVEIFAHELGHALGFGHAPNGTPSVMDQAGAPMPLDCQGLRNYYK